MPSRSSLEGHIRLRRRPDIGRAGPDEPVVVLLLDHVRAPAGDARADEDRRVEVAGGPSTEGGPGGGENRVGGGAPPPPTGPAPTRPRSAPPRVRRPPR